MSNALLPLALGQEPLELGRILKFGMWFSYEKKLNMCYGLGHMTCMWFGYNPQIIFCHFFFFFFYNLNLVILGAF